MAEAVVSLALETLGDLLLEEARFLPGVGNEVGALEKQLKEIKCLLDDADRRQHEAKALSNWIAEIRDLALRSEDVIETYAVKTSSTRGSSFKKLLSRFSPHRIGLEISEIESELAKIKEDMKEFGIKSIIHGESSTSCSQTSSIESEDYFLGNDDYLKTLVSLMVDEKQEPVISIWGLGGIGKTTIARKVYNHTDIRRSFECFAWVCITQQFHIRAVLEDIFVQLIPWRRGSISYLSNAALIQNICQIQRTKRCMVVLDDLCEVEHWNGLRDVVAVRGSNSKVLMTTRKQNVADMGFAVKLGLLNIDDGWELLKKKAFPCNNIPDNVGVDEKQFQKIGKEMVRKCGHLPLVISILGGLLSTRKSIGEWEAVSESINAHLHTEESEIHGVLNLSYDDLPFYLKPCFLFMAQFREDSVINSEDLYRLWIAHGMVLHEHRRKDETLMDVAEAYLSELDSRGLIQIPYLNVKWVGKYSTLLLHDVVRELCLSKGKTEGFNFEVLTCEGGEFNGVLNKPLLGIETRHLAIHFEGQTTSNPNGFTVHADSKKHVRSLHFLNREDNVRIEFQHITLGLEKFKLLKSLVFKNFKFKQRELRCIGDLIHLRKLALVKCILEELPSSIKNLKYLQTLDLYLSWNVRMPNVWKEMHRMKYLSLPFYRKEWVAQNNYHLTLEGLDELEKLDGFNSLVHDWKSVMKMKNLRIIGAMVYDNETLSAVVNAMNTNWTTLRSCKLDIHDGCRLESTEEGLVILKNVFSCQALIQLTISVTIKKMQLEKCLTEISTSRLVTLYLYDCDIKDDPMEILGKFPFLEDLYLWSCAFLGDEMKCHALGFPRLKIIKLDALPFLREWIVEEGAMPLLTLITIQKCPRLEMIPDGLRFTRKLQMLMILDVPQLGKRVDAQVGEDFDKVCHVLSIIVG